MPASTVAIIVIISALSYMGYLVWAVVELRRPDAPPPQPVVDVLYDGGPDFDSPLQQRIDGALDSRGARLADHWRLVEAGYVRCRSGARR